jgi:putative transposase
VGVEAPSYRGFRFPAEIISHGVWLYYRFPLSFREVQEMMLARGVIVSHELTRQWCAKFGQTDANGLRRRRTRPGDKWHLDLVGFSSEAATCTATGRPFGCGVTPASWLFVECFEG